MNTTNSFNRYKYNHQSLEPNRQNRANPYEEYELAPQQPPQTLHYPVRNPQPAPTLTNSLNKQIFNTLKDKEREFVSDMNYYQNLNLHGLPEPVAENLGHTRSRFVRGDSHAEELRSSNAHTLMPKKKKEDFLDRFIKRQNIRHGYYKNTDKLETFKCDKHPEFLTNSEFLPGNKENGVTVDLKGLAGTKSAALMPQSVIVNRNLTEVEVDRQWGRNYGNVLENQKVFKDVNYMDMATYNKLSRRVDTEFVGARDQPVIDPRLKNTILSLYRN